jgi:pSer/pThr/pTyr-binding forkhead associated (FHA) protein
MPNSYRLVIRSGPTAGKIFPLEKNELFVGRDLNNEVVINDPEVSRRHARLYAQGNSYVLEDLGSTNGTFVTGQRLTGPYPLRVGEVITFGERITVVYEVEQDLADATVVSAAARQVPSQPLAQPQVVQPVQQPYVAPQQIPPAQQPQFQPPVAQQQSYQQQVPPAYVSQPPLPAQPAYSGQVPYQAPIDQQQPVKKNNRTMLIILVVLLVVICLCVAIGLFFAPKEFWCIFPIWPAGACS